MDDINFAIYCLSQNLDSTLPQSTTSYETIQQSNQTQQLNETQPVNETQQVNQMKQFNETQQVNQTQQYDQEPQLVQQQIQDAGNGKTEYIRRPMNPFMVYSKYFRRHIARNNPRMPNPLISKILGVQWKQLPIADKLPYIDEAKRLRNQHKIDHPEYRYTPKRRVKEIRKYSKKNCEKILPEHNNDVNFDVGRADAGVSVVNQHNNNVQHSFNSFCGSTAGRYSPAGFKGSYQMQPQLGVLPLTSLLPQPQLAAPPPQPQLAAPPPLPQLAGPPPQPQLAMTPHPTKSTELYQFQNSYTNQFYRSAFTPYDGSLYPPRRMNLFSTSFSYFSNHNIETESAHQPNQSEAFNGEGHQFLQQQDSPSFGSF